MDFPVRTSKWLLITFSFAKGRVHINQQKWRLLDMNSCLSFPKANQNLEIVPMPIKVSNVSPATLSPTGCQARPGMPEHCFSKAGTVDSAPGQWPSQSHRCFSSNSLSQEGATGQAGQGAKLAKAGEQTLTAGVSSPLLLQVSTCCSALFGALS